MAPDVPLDGRKIHGIQIGGFPKDSMPPLPGAMCSFRSMDD